MSYTTDRIEEIGMVGAGVAWGLGAGMVIENLYEFQYYDTDKSGATGEELADACHRDLYYLCVAEADDLWDPNYFARQEYVDYLIALLESPSGYDVFYSGRYDTSYIKNLINSRLGIDENDLAIFTGQANFNREDSTSIKQARFLTMVYRNNVGRRDGSIGGIRRSS